MNKRRFKLPPSPKIRVFWLFFLLVAGVGQAEVILNELHYDPDNKIEPAEFVEIHNTGTGAVDIGNWSLEGAVDYTFPPGTSLPAGGYVVVAEDPATVLSKYGTTAFGPWLGQLNNDGERLALRDALTDKVDEVDYQLGFPWPTVGGAPGYSIELIHPSLDNDLAGSWRASMGQGLGSGELIPAGSTWRYAKGTAEASSPMAAWRQVGFSDSGWLSGATPMGYGENFITTPLNDMYDNYTTVYLRKSFTLADAAAVDQLVLSMQFDDGFNAWINGSLVASANSPGENVAYNGVATANINDNDWIDFSLPDPSTYLTTGSNVLAIQLLNSRIRSGDAFASVRLQTSTGSSAGPTPGANNSVYSTVAPPQIRQVEHTPKQPIAGEVVTITAKVTDPDGMGTVALSYQTVEPGSYIRQSDAAYEASWTTVSMLDNGTGGDAVAGDSTYTVQLPGTLQTHRRLVRYRIEVADSLGHDQRVPYPDDPQPNFAYFCYDGVPDWSGSPRPGVEPVETFSGDALSTVPVYQLLAIESDVINCQYNGSYNDDVYRWEGTFIYDNKVYDHIRFRIRGGASTYSTGKNKWKFNFTRGHRFQARDRFDNKYPEKWDKLTISAGTCPWWANDQSTGGMILNDVTSMRMYRLAGLAASESHLFHFRVIDDTVEADPSDQYEGDFWGLYMAIEETDTRFVQARDLPDGNVYNMHSSVGGSVKKNQGATDVLDYSDLSDITSSSIGYRRSSPIQDMSWYSSHIDLEGYYRFRAINVLVNNTDMYVSSSNIERNMVFYHNPVTGLWTSFPWDMDLTYESAPHWSRADTLWDHLNKVLQHTEARRAYENRVRHLVDLLVDNGEAGRVIDEFAAQAGRVLPDGSLGETNSIALANQAMWDYHPRTTKKGIFYVRNSLLPSQDFPGLASYMKTFMTPSGYAGARLVGKLTLTDIPNRPAVTYTGPGGYPRDVLDFSVSAYQHPQGAGTFAAMEWRLAEVLPPGASTYPTTGPLPYEIDEDWTSGELTSYASSMTLPPEITRPGTRYRVRVRMKDTLGNWSHWSHAAEFTAGFATFTPASATNLRITEIHYHPPTEPDAEFIELMNISAGPINLAGAAFDKGIDFRFGDLELAAGARIFLVKDPAVFATVYGSGLTPAGTYSGSLNNGGERILLLDAVEATIQDLTYGDDTPWPPRADGDGSSLDRWNILGSIILPEDWFASVEYNGTPGTAGMGPQTDVVLNEVLAHTDLPLTDRIELFNPTATPVNMDGWYLSDSAGRPLKYQIPNGTTLAAGGYMVFDESDFNPYGDWNTDPGKPPVDTNHHFALNSALGDEVILMETDGSSNPLRFVDTVDFGATLNGESVGRYPNGSGEWYNLAARSFGASNGPPRIGPVVLNEIMYHPGPSTNLAVYEYIELLNTGTTTEDLQDWSLDEAVDFTFPVGTLLAPHATLVIAAISPTDSAALATFQAQYGPITPLGPWAGRLNNAGDIVRLLRADDPPAEQPELIPLIEEERVAYQPVLPWDPDADGTGSALHRVDPEAFGNEASNWIALRPHAGGVFDDPLFEAWREQRFTEIELANPTVSGPEGNPDGDLHDNYSEYVADTNPHDPASMLTLRIDEEVSDMELSFASSAIRWYKIHRTVDLQAGSWEAHSGEIQGTGGILTLQITNPSASAVFCLEAALSEDQLEP